MYCHLSIYPYITALLPTAHAAPQFDARTAKTRRTDIQRYHPNPKSETLSSLSQARQRPQNRPSPAFARPTKACPPHGKTAPLVRNGEAVSAYDASSTPKTADISHTPNRARPLCQIRQPKSCECDAQHRFVAPRLRRHRNPHKRTRISDNPLKFARNMCSLSDCPQFNRFKLQHTTQNTPSPDARAHSTATAAPATRLNSSTHKEHPANSHPNTAF